ncbi:MAG: phosphoenolpyruvate synthase [Deltaproteobacteria bacterium]|nr:phosphoenolpyruvate synthase [Deltaproteobacteria bacterium]
MKAVQSPNSKLSAVGVSILILTISFYTTLCAVSETVAQTPTVDPDISVLGRAWISEMKNSPRGPFSGIRWYCKDGTSQPARGRGCTGRGGGVQHGEWSAQTKRLRESGFPIATVYADLDEYERIKLRNHPHQLAFLLLERFLVTFDEGWILRQASNYRGAFQVEDEIAAAQELLITLIPDYHSDHYFLLREAVRLLPRRAPDEFLSRIRATSTRLAAANRRFTALRNKLHAYPDASDAERVQEFAQSVSPSSAAPYYELADMIDKAYADEGLMDSLRRLSGLAASDLSNRAVRLYEIILRHPSPSIKYETYTDLLLFLRKNLSTAGSTAAKLAALETSIQLEQALYAVGRTLIQTASRTSRRELINFLDQTALALYGTGLLSEREYRAVRASQQNLQKPRGISASTYADELRYLSLVPAWATRQLEFDFNEAAQKMAIIEPLAKGYVADRLRQSPLLFYSQVLEYLAHDASQLNGFEHGFFGRKLSIGLRALNPGLTRGVLVRPGSSEARNVNPSEAIYLVPETVEEIPAVKGILTAREGNLLSHVQLLARNLGVPNVVVDEKLLPELERYLGKTIIVAASPGGRVHITRDGPEWNEIFKQQERQAKIEPNLRKLNLGERRILTLKKLRASDSGRTVGPKAANLGELKSHFPEYVAGGVAIPFGVFRDALEQPYQPGASISLFEWLKNQYRSLDQSTDPPALRAQKRASILERARQAMLSIQFKPSFVAELQRTLSSELGPIGRYGVFVRSDSNVEDLPSFTGAGLNLTIPNVIQFDHMLGSIREVWASLYSERAFGWRQAAMSKPEEVYISTLLMQSVPVEKSGVMVVADVETGDPNYLTVAANFGIGGVVSNQAAETLRISRRDGTVRLYSSAAAHSKTVLDPQGGIQKVTLDRRERVLTELELIKLHNFAKQLPDRYPRIVDGSGKVVPAEIEFGFRLRQLSLFQIRPFLQSVKRKEMEYLRGLDQKDSLDKQTAVNLDARPWGRGL